MKVAQVVRTKFVPLLRDQLGGCAQCAYRAVSFRLCAKSLCLAMWVDSIALLANATDCQLKAHSGGRFVCGVSKRLSTSHLEDGLLPEYAIKAVCGTPKSWHSRE